MRKILLTVGFALAASTAVAGPRLPMDSLAFLSHENNDRACASFAIAPEYFLTASHCGVNWDTGVRYDDVLIDGNKGEVVAFDTRIDIALIKVRHYAKPAVEFDTKADLGERAFAIGFPFGTPDPLVLPESYAGIWPAAVSEDGLDWMVFMGRAMSGMSGGPIVGENGKVLSVVSSMGYPGTQQANSVYAALPEAVHSLLRAYGVE